MLDVLLIRMYCVEMESYVDSDVLPPLIVCTSWDVVVSMLKGLANVFGAARRAHREEKIREVPLVATHIVGFIDSFC